MSFVQRVANWLLGDYPVATTEVGTGTTRRLVQHIMTVDASDNYVSGGGGGGGDASAANQLTEIASLASIDGKLPALGQALAAASVPIVLTAAQITTLTPPAAITGFATSARQDTGNTSLASIDGKITAVNTGAVVISSGTVTTVSTVTSVTAIGTSVTPGTSAAHLGKAEDAACGTGDTGVFMLGVRRDAPTQSGGTAGDYCEVNVSAQGGVWSSLTPSKGGGWTPYSNTALSSTKQQIVAAATSNGGYYWYNPNASVSYIQVWDLASASVTVGTTAPTYVIGIPASSGANVEFANGIKHGTGFTVAATTTPTGSTAPGSALVGFFLYL